MLAPLTFLQCVADATAPVGLVRGKNRELDAGLCENLEALEVSGGFGKPHAFGKSSEARSKSRMPQRTCVSLSRRFASGMMM